MIFNSEQLNKISYMTLSHDILKDILNEWINLSHSELGIRVSKCINFGKNLRFILC